jgi:ABC-type Co2+ transport system permease subunit
VHIPDGFLDATTAMGTGLVAGGAVAAALQAGRDQLADRQIPLVGVTSALCSRSR